APWMTCRSLPAAPLIFISKSGFPVAPLTRTTEPDSSLVNQALPRRNWTVWSAWPKPNSAAKVPAVITRTAPRDANPEEDDHQWPRSARGTASPSPEPGGAIAEEGLVVMGGPPESCSPVPGGCTEFA